jgi:hypothetical protein
VAQAEEGLLGHAFSWGGELGRLSLNLPQASWLLRMTDLLVTPGSRCLQPTTGKLKDSAGFARWLAQNSQNLARVIQAVFWLEWVGCGPRSSARVIRRAKRRRDLPDEGRLMREVEGPRRCPLADALPSFPATHYKPYQKSKL